MELPFINQLTVGKNNAMMTPVAEVARSMRFSI
jgi:hypothetical protein